VNELTTVLIAIVLGLLAVVVLLLVGFLIMVRNNTAAMTLMNTRMTDLSTKVDLTASSSGRLVEATARLEEGLNVLIRRPND
jgi:hypothetical protein